MRAAKQFLRWSALGLLGAWILAGAWLLTLQVMLVLFSPVGHWQTPRIYQVVVVRIEKDPEKVYTDQVVVKHGEQERVLEMLKEEQAGLHPEDELWILENYYATSLRPAQFRLTPQRLALEYPLPLMVLAGLGIWAILRFRLGIPPEPVPDPDRPRRRLTDDFHLRAQRFGDDQGTPPPEAP